MDINEIRAIANYGRGSEMTKALHEMLDINEELLEALESCVSSLIIPTGSGKALDAMRNARAVIAKAKGERSE